MGTGIGGVPLDGILVGAVGNSGAEQEPVDIKLDTADRAVDIKCIREDSRALIGTESRLVSRAGDIDDRKLIDIRTVHEGRRLECDVSGNVKSRLCRPLDS